MIIKTERLTITDFTMEMAEAVHLGSLDEATRNFVPDEVFETIDDARETLEYLISVYEYGNGPLVYPVVYACEYIGYVQAVPMDEGQWEIGYHINETHRNHGYATEAVSAFLPVIMRQIGISSILGICLSENPASAKVMEKCGFKKVFQGIDRYHGNDEMICKYVFSSTNPCN